jgi:hypothetical protein
MDMQCGMFKERAISINAKLRYGTEEEKAEAEKLEAIERANRVIDTMP